MHKHTMSSPIGTLTLVEAEGALAGIYFEGHKPAPRGVEALPVAASAVLRDTEAMIETYFQRPNSRANVTIPRRGTELQRAVWSALLDIPPSQTISYAELARRVGKPRAVRAVAQAVARNPLSIVVPCHRVVGSDGSTTGYAGGVARKEWLLAHERNAARS
ncbi:MAG: methylated-DNA--[protein]-cysteine S-methyltransferase [Polyangiales bacterium]